MPIEAKFFTKKTIRQLVVEAEHHSEIKELKERVKKLEDAIRRIFHEAVDREMCDSIARGFALATIAGMCEEAIGAWCEKCEKIGCNCKNEA